ncbi:MAG: hypothetical protein KH415_24010 [Clostridium sp.]|nr:hypothetical protein [Clostridium sp.]
MTQYKKSISSKYISIFSVENFINAFQNTNDIKCNGILLVMPFGIVYGKFQSIDVENPKTLGNVLLSSNSKCKQSYIDDNYELKGDGSQILLKDAVVKYPTGITLNMDEIIIFSDQVCGYYPVDLDAFYQT